MAQHKAPTQVTVVTEEKSAFAQHIESKWKLYAGVAVIISAAVVALQASRNAAVASSQAVWDALAAGTDYFPGQGLTATSTRALEEAIEDGEVRDTPAEAVGRALLVGASANRRDYEEAMASLAAVREEGLEPWTGVEFPVGPEGAEITLAELVSERLAQQKAWEASHAGIFQNPPLPEGSPRVRITTSEGDIVIGLFQEEAPQHVENFLKLVDDGFYVDTKFHRVLEDFMIQGGDPNTKTRDKIDEWGTGGPGYKIGPEFNDLAHLRGYVSAAKQPNEFQSSGSQFFITTGDANWLDGQHCVFGVVLEGMDVVEKIEQGELETGDRPRDPVAITAVSRI